MYTHVDMPVHMHVHMNVRVPVNDVRAACELPEKWGRAHHGIDAGSLNGWGNRLRMTF